jgi:hypothetical protein
VYDPQAACGEKKQVRAVKGVENSAVELCFFNAPLFSERFFVFFNLMVGNLRQPAFEILLYYL